MCKVVGFGTRERDTEWETKVRGKRERKKDSSRRVQVARKGTLETSIWLVLSDRQTTTTTPAHRAYSPQLKLQISVQSGIFWILRIPYAVRVRA
ncbi:hypothetical protein O3P69_007409 [Scylla paramamosain]|uniref:Uncharacterized protein n=1 Tax=Scylla paramamosain TaxID=85552 RepID=A0AAW0V760_SCYPA